MRVEDKQLAMRLRRRGLTYGEILAKIPGLGKGTLSSWLRGLVLTESQSKRIIEKVRLAGETNRAKGALGNKIKAAKRIDRITNEATVEFPSLAKIPLFMLGVALYWAEGSKRDRRFEFVNSDPTMIKIVLLWLRTILGVKEEDIFIRLYAHEAYRKENCEKFWADTTRVPLSNFRKTVYRYSPYSVKKNPDYKGCCRIELKGSIIYWKTMAWQGLLADSFIKMPK